jgi:hypothetical protein
VSEIAQAAPACPHCLSRDLQPRGWHRPDVGEIIFQFSLARPTRIQRAHLQTCKALASIGATSDWELATQRRGRQVTESCRHEVKNGDISGNGAGEKISRSFFGQVPHAQFHAQSGFSLAKIRYFGGISLWPVALSKRLALFLCRAD